MSWDFIKQQTKDNPWFGTDPPMACMKERMHYDLQCVLAAKVSKNVLTHIAHYTSIRLDLGMFDMVHGIKKPSVNNVVDTVSAEVGNELS